MQGTCDSRPVWTDSICLLQCDNLVEKPNLWVEILETIKSKCSSEKKKCNNQSYRHSKAAKIILWPSAKKLFSSTFDKVLISKARDNWSFGTQSILRPFLRSRGQNKKIISKRHFWFLSRDAVFFNLVGPNRPLSAGPAYQKINCPSPYFGYGLHSFGWIFTS